MRLKTLALKGVTVFKTKQEVDFTQIPEGIVAITGPNGSGKTTLMEAIYAAIYREMPSHGSLYENCSGRDAFLQLRFEMDGKPYDAEVLIDTVSQKQEAFLSTNGTPLANGKVTAYDREIQNVVGSSRMTLSSVFNAQNRKGSFLTMPVAERKSLFTEMLGLGHCPVIEKEARTHAATHEHEFLSLAAEAARQREIASKRPGIAVEKSWCESGAEKARQAVETIDADRMGAMALLAELEQESAAEARDRQAFAAANEEVRRLETMKETLEQRTCNIADAIEDEKLRLAHGVSLLETRITEIDGRIAQNQDLQRRKDEIEQAMALRFGLGQAAKRLGEEFDEAVTTERSRQAFDRQKLSLEHAGVQIQTAITVAEGDAAALQTIPCHGKPPYDTCPMIIGAVESRAKLPELIDLRRQMLLGLDSMVLVDQGRSMDLIRTELRTAEADYEASSKYLVLKSELDASAQRISELEAQLNDLCAQRLALIARSAVLHGPGGDPALKEAQQGVERCEVALNEQVALARELRTRLEAAEPKAKLRDETKARIVALEREARTSLTDAASMEARAAALQEPLDATIAAETRLEEIESLSATTREQAADWGLLAKAFGKDGIPALEIDAAGPGISTLANDLLSSCFSDRFTVDLKTQRLSADGDRLLEDFDIRVIDSEQGRAGSIDQLSGGEKVVVNEAIGIAIAVYNKQERHLETLFRDETTGALDSENAPRYVAMLKRALKMGGFSRCLFITHSQECAELADARIHCEDGKITVEV